MKKLFYAFLLASVALTACNTDETSDLMLTDVELKASIDLVDGSRVAFDQEGDFFWTSNDAIGVTTTQSATRFSKMSMKEGGAGQAKATFYAKFMSGTPEGYAVYPHNANHSMDGSVLTYNFPTSYTYTIEDHSYFVTDGTGNSFNPAMWATIENGSVHFKHLGGVLCIMIADLPAGEDQTLTVTTSQRITGDFTADLSVAEPVLVTDDAAGNVVTIAYSNVAESDRVFYVPVPTGVYEEICVSFEAEGEPVEVYFSNKTVNARSLKMLKIGDCELEGGEATKPVASVPEANEQLEEGATSVVISNIAADATDATIVIPNQAAADTEVSIKIEQVDFDGTIVIDEADEVTTPVAVLNVTLPEEAVDNVVIDMPHTTVYVNGVIANLTATTAANTLVVSDGAQITNLTVKGGNVFIAAGAGVQAVVRDAENADEVTYVYYEAGATVPTQVGEGVVLVSDAEKVLREAVAAGGSYTLTSDIVLGSPLVVATDFELDLNGYTISFSDAVQGGAMLTNNGTLIIKNGTVAYEYTGEADTSNSKGNYAIQNNGELAINNVKVTVAVPGKAEGEKFSHALYAVNNAGVFEMDGAESYIYNANNVAMRMWGSDNSAVTVKDGHIKGVRAIWLQLPSSSTTAAPKVSLTVEGGKLEATGEPGGYKLAIYSYNYGNKLDNVNIDVDGGEFVGDIALTGGTNKAQVEKLTINDGLFNGGIYSYAPVEVAVQYVTINGGLFTDEAKEKTNSALFGEGVGFVQNADGLWAIEKLLEKVDENTYAVSTVEGLQWVADQVNTGKNYFEGKTIVLANDIDLNNVEWTPIGSMTQDHGFMGNFDGNNKTIKNLNITAIKADADGSVYAGLFGLTEGDETNSNFVKNLTIENVNIECTGDIAASLIAYAYYTTVENITVKGDINIKGRDYVSGVLAYTRRCVVAKDLTVEGNAGSVIEGRNTVGGVISDIQTNGGLVADYSNFKASGLTIKATKSVGGISGIISGQTLNGATVENVEIVCDNVHKGIVSGSLGEKSTIANISYNNVTGATAVVGAVYGTGNPVEAKVGDVYYKTSFQDVLANAQAGETVTMFVDVTASDIVVVDKAITIDGNGHKLTSTAGRAINVQAEGNVVIKNLTVECSGERGVNVIQKPANVTLEQVTMKAANYTVNAASSAAGATIAVKNSTLTGKNMVNVGGENVHVTVENTTLNCVDDSAVEGYSVLALNKDAKNSSIAATGCTFNIPADSDSVKATNAAEGGEITIDGSTTDVDIDVAAVEYGNYYYGFTTLEGAIAHAAANGQPVKLVRDIELNASLVLTDEGTLDLNGHSISQKQAQSAAYNMIQNKGNWTIKNGTLDYADTANLTASVNYVSNTIQNGGSLTLENVKVVNNSVSAVAANGYPHPIDNSGKLVINSGEFTNNANYSSMRIWCTEDTDTEVIINGGTFNGAIDFQNVSAKPNKGTLTINGGTFNPNTYTNTNAAVRLLGFGVDVDEINGYIKGGTFNGAVKLNKYASGEFNSQVFFVSGGKFKFNPSDFLVEGCTSTQEGDYYVVK